MAASASLSAGTMDHGASSGAECWDASTGVVLPAWSQRAVSASQGDLIEMQIIGSPQTYWIRNPGGQAKSSGFLQASQVIITLWCLLQCEGQCSRAKGCVLENLLTPDKKDRTPFFCSLTQILRVSGSNEMCSCINSFIYYNINIPSACSFSQFYSIDVSGHLGRPDWIKTRIITELFWGLQDSRILKKFFFVKIHLLNFFIPAGAVSKRDMNHKRHLFSHENTNQCLFCFMIFFPYTQKTSDKTADIRFPNVHFFFFF